MKGVFLCIAIIICSLCVRSQGVFDYYISNTGNDANAGNSKLAPKKTIAGVSATIANGSLGSRPLSIGFKSGDVFNETFNPGFPLRAATYFDGSSKNFAILNGTEVFDNGWIRTATSANLYEQSVTLSGYSGYGINNVGQYSIVSVFEIDRVLERTAPFTARKLLKFINNMQAADATPGSFYEPVTVDVNPMKIYIHTSDGSSPNNNARYRYEITVRDRAFNSTFQQNNVFERLWIRGYGAGNGMIPAGANSSFNRMIFGPAAGIHHLGLRGATISNSLFLPSALNTDFYAVVFYDVEGYKRHNLIKNTIFLDVRYPVYAHTSQGTNFGALELDNVIALADTSEVESFMEIANTDSALLNNVYTSGHKIGYGYGHAPYFSAKNCSFIDVVNGIAFGVETRTGIINNCFVRTRGATAKNFGVVMSDTSNVLLANSIFHIKNYKQSALLDFMGGFVDGAGRKLNSINAHGNIFISDVDPSKYVLAASAANPASSNAADSRWQNNVYILLRGNKIAWRIFKDYNTPGSQDVLVNFEDWKLRTGNDTRSLFFDLRNDPRGLKAIFTDPDNGDYSLASTFEANKIRELRAGMVSPISCFLQKPSYEEAARIIMNDGVLSANACRNPCVQNNIRINHMFEAALPSARKVQLQWNMEDERSIDHYEIVRSFGNTDFTTIAYVPAGGLANYSYTDSNVMAGITYRYSVLVVTKLIDKCYSEVRSVKLEDGKPVTIYPNPSPGIIKLALNNYTGPVKISVTNVLGIKVYSKELNSFYGMPVEIDLSAQSKGFYWIKVQTDKDHPIQSFILR